ncbi:MAG: MFS transporter [Planctomycetes bacterium]|nr:MFS transporter [Planctomycetota bacterium]
MLAEPKLSWRFPATFWIANVAELFERAAFYGMFIVLVVYLSDVVGFTDIEAGNVAAGFAALLYLLPPFLGALADKIGFRAALIVAFASLSAGYFLLGALPYKPTTVISLALVAFGGAIVKPVISGTAAQCSDERHRARAFSVFYWAVNIGSFSGKTFAAPLREHYGLAYIDYFSAAAAFAALLWVTLFYRNVNRSAPTRTFDDICRGFGRVLTNFRFMALILIVAGFWIIQGQIYATMSKYVFRLLGPGARPEWLANVNPLVVVLCVVPITHAIRKLKPESAIGIGLFIIPFSAVAIACSPLLEAVTGKSLSVFGWFTLHPVTALVIVGIAIQGLAECFLSPKFLEYASRQAPPGEEGLYMGYQHLTTFFAWFAGFILSGHLLDRFCPDPAKMPAEVRASLQAAIETGSALPAEYAHAHYIWIVYAGIGVAAFLALHVFRIVTGRVDRYHAAATADGAA